MLKLSEDFKIYYPVKIKDGIYFEKFKPNKSPEPYFSGIRAVEPVSIFFTGKPEEKRIIMGVKACDIAGLRVLDKIIKDENYHKMRKETILVTADCPFPEETCFCNLRGIEPYCDEDADIVISPLGDRYLLQAISDRGKKIIDKTKNILSIATESDIAEKLRIRKEAKEKLKVINEREFKSIKENCVRCFGCRYICPTCYCEEKICSFEERIECKAENCTGCGRCISVCPGMLDIRSYLK